jgi:HEPN domain-containing protein
MKRHTAQWVRKAEDDLHGARALARLRPPQKDLACFHCQQSAEKYLKALLQELGAAIPKTHDLEDLLDLLLPHDSTLGTLRRCLRSLTRYAVEYRYPGIRATLRRMQAALQHAKRVRKVIQAQLGLA